MAGWLLTYCYHFAREQSPVSHDSRVSMISTKDANRGQENSKKCRPKLIQVQQMVLLISFRFCYISRNGTKPEKQCSFGPSISRREIVLVQAELYRPEHLDT